MFKYMGKYYAAMEYKALKTLRSQKVLRLAQMDRYPDGFFLAKERAKLKIQIVWIDAEINCRKDQMKLDL